MAITIKPELIERRLDNAFMLFGKFDADNAYPTGGYLMTGIHPRIKKMWAEGGSYVWVFDADTKKLKAMKHSGTSPNILLVEEANNTDLSAQTGIEYAALVVLE